MERKIAIVGAGIGGLAAAALLARDGHDVTVFDQFAKAAPVGSGLVVQPVGQAVLRQAGAWEAAAALGQSITRMKGSEVEAGRPVLDVIYDPGGRPGAGRFGLAIHRAALFNALLQAAERAGARLVAGARVVSAPLAPGGRQVIAADSANLGQFSLVVDAAGAGSTLSPLHARPLPFGAIWGTVPWPAGTDLPDDQLSQRYFRASHMAGVLPLGRMTAEGPRLAAVFWSLPRWALDLWKEADVAAWKEEVETLWPAMAPFLETIRQPADMVPASYTHGALARPYEVGLVHLGDAAHRASPQLGQGANMALLDALALARAKRAAPGDPGPDYARMRRWHVRLYQGLSAAFTPQYQSESRVLPVLRDRVLAPLSRLWPLPPILSRLVSGDLIPPLAGEVLGPLPCDTAEACTQGAPAAKVAP